MPNGSQITIIGNTGESPDLRFTPTGTQVVSFSVAVPERRKNQAGEWVDVSTTWYRVNAWRGLAEHIAESVGKGTRVIVFGSLASREWSKDDGTHGVSWEIRADAVGIDLTWATATVHRAARSDVPIPDDPWAGSDTGSETGSETATT
jgi:single-strand DNA-binding protein